MTKTNNESGRTMLEMLGVLAIMGVIMYGAIAGIQFGVDMYKINASFNDIEELAQGISDLYSWTSNYPENPKEIMTAAYKNNIVAHLSPSYESEMVSGFVGEFSGSTITVEPITDDDGSRRQFKITYTGIPAMACRRLSAMTYNNVRQPESTCSESGKVASIEYISR